MRLAPIAIEPEPAPSLPGVYSRPAPDFFQAGDPPDVTFARKRGWRRFAQIETQLNHLATLLPYD